jgi:hypothetical protein
MDEAAYRHAVDVKACRIRTLADQMQRTSDSVVLLTLSRELRRATRELRDVVHAHVVANNRRRKQAAAPSQAWEKEP